MHIDRKIMKFLIKAEIFAFVQKLKFISQKYVHRDIINDKAGQAAALGTIFILHKPQYIHPMFLEH